MLYGLEDEEDNAFDVVPVGSLATPDNFTDKDGVYWSKVFVYGTLKKGFHNHDLISRELVNKFLGTGELPGYNMRHVGQFPAIYRSKMAVDTVPVQGEVWLINQRTLDSLDILEGVKHGLYARIKERIPNHGMCYVYTQEFPKEDSWRIVTNGTWVGPTSPTTLAQKATTANLPSRRPWDWDNAARRLPALPHIPAAPTPPPPPEYNPSKILWPNVKSAEIIAPRSH